MRDNVQLFIVRELHYSLLTAKKYLTLCLHLSRLDISIILSHKELNSVEGMSNDEMRDNEITDVDYEKLSVTHSPNSEELAAKLHAMANDPKYATRLIDLSAYINDSALSVQSNFSLHRAYIIYRTLGLRHLTVVDRCNRVVGMITRKDLMGFNLEEKITEIIDEQSEENQYEMTRPV